MNRLITLVFVFETKRRTTRFKERKALNNKFVCITCKVYRNWTLIKSLSCAKKIERDPKVSESRFGMLVKSQADHPLFVSCNDFIFTRHDRLKFLLSRDI